ncbi:alpha/beta fold hydrolase [Planctomycetota bacterium]
MHGGPGAPGSVASLARDLAGEFRVLEPLQRRHGDIPLSVAQHVDDLEAVAPGTVALVGWSWGAMLALSYAARHPARVQSLVLVGCGTYGEASRAIYREAIHARLGPSGQARSAEIQRLLMTELDFEERDKFLGELGDLHERAQAVDPLPSEGAGEDELPVDAAGHVETWQDVLRLQQEGVEPAAFAAIRAPVLMLHGEDDPHPGPATYELLRRYVPHLKYLGFERCGHKLWRERHAREPFLRELRDWLRSSPR